MIMIIGYFWGRLGHLGRTNMDFFEVAMQTLLWCWTALLDNDIIITTAMVKLFRAQWWWSAVITAGERASVEGDWELQVVGRQVKPFGNISTPFTMIGQYFSTQSMLNTLVEPLFKYLNQAWWWWRWWPLEAIHRSQTFLHLVWYDTWAQIHLGLIGLWSYSCIMVKFTRDVHNGCIQRDSRAKMVIWAEGEFQEMGNMEGWKDVENKKWKYRNKLWSNIITFPMLGLTTSSERASFIRRSVTTWKSRIRKNLESEMLINTWKFSIRKSPDFG